MNHKNKQETKTTLTKKQEVSRQWLILDAKGKTLGRFCAEIAKILRGKHKTSFTPNVDMGDGVIVVNAEKIHVTGAKEAQKIYRYYTGHIGGQREMGFRDLRANDPSYIIWHAVRGMMPKSRLGNQQMRGLRIFAGETTTFQAQQPIKVEM